MEHRVWALILSHIEAKVNHCSFSTWFKPIAFVADSGSSITLRVPNALFRDWLIKKYGVVLSEALTEVGRAGTALVFLTERSLGSSPE
jgi:chromosomal replication initiator protein